MAEADGAVRVDARGRAVARDALGALALAAGEALRLWVVGQDNGGDGAGGGKNVGAEGFIPGRQ